MPQPTTTQTPENKLKHFKSELNHFDWSTLNNGRAPFDPNVLDFYFQCR